MPKVATTPPTRHFSIILVLSLCPPRSSHPRTALSLPLVEDNPSILSPLSFSFDLLSFLGGGADTPPASYNSTCSLREHYLVHRDAGRMGDLSDGKDEEGGFEGNRQD
ncbi:hypothetical protein EV401DRAFT_2040008, partial [Pisolithus croceorrhizus]